MDSLKKWGILPWVLLAIVLGIVFGQFLPVAIAKIFFTFNEIFSQFLSFSIPLIIVGLIVPAIADLGKGAGKWLSITAALAYGSTLFSGFLTYLVCELTFPKVLQSGMERIDEPTTLEGFFTIEMPPVFGVMTALVLAFLVGIGLSLVPRGVLRKGFLEFREIITKLISNVIVPLLPLHIFGIFLNMTLAGDVAKTIRVLLAVVVIVILLEIVILLAQFGLAGAIAKKNPFKALATMMPAYLTALGTSSSAATIPVTLAQTRKNGVSDTVSAFTVPLCATIHLSGSTSKIVAFALAIILVNDIPVTTAQIVGFIFLLGVTMVAAPGVPGGAIMAATGILSSMLGFADADVALMIATYIALDPFGTATNVTGDGAISLVVDKLAGGELGAGEPNENVRGFDGFQQFDAAKYIDEVLAGHDSIDGSRAAGALSTDQTPAE